MKCLKKYVYQYFLSAASMTPNNDYHGGNYHPPHSTLDFQVQDQNTDYFTSPPPHDEGDMIVCCPRSLKSLCYSYIFPFVVVLTIILLITGFMIWFFSQHIPRIVKHLWNRKVAHKKTLKKLPGKPRIYFSFWFHFKVANVVGFPGFIWTLPKWIVAWNSYRF